jgi:hypothetical protein
VNRKLLVHFTAVVSAQELWKIQEQPLLLKILENSTFFNERIMIAIIQEDKNSNTRRRRVVESSE